MGELATLPTKRDTLTINYYASTTQRAINPKRRQDIPSYLSNQLKPISK
jgi:hypothetical protein